MKIRNVSMLEREMELLRSSARKNVLDRIKKSNLERLRRTCILENFVRENNGGWDHQQWLNLCEDISLCELEPIDFDKVGLMLEEEKARYFAFKTYSLDNSDLIMA